ncbi:hypothetical protein OVS_02350 [Mycoplasma ovis str. Michigan]|uniref:Uncharacterized protein n=1 Tax=Mycoplasma ovis str. Michigan TaxID=1415773 RepID=A0ABN4BL51_9MOLU|nr:hypothetical protein [Mycoplasma ovis]AHC39951.1 hypothetical protein OVS_02350 [Mycoplasma ovis str. Michigan]
MKTYQEALSASSDLLLSALSTQESSIQRAIKDISSKIKQLVEQIQKLTKEIQTIHQEIELLKKNISTVKNYEGKFLNAICSLYTFENKECGTK